MSLCQVVEEMRFVNGEEILCFTLLCYLGGIYIYCNTVNNYCINHINVLFLIVGLMEVKSGRSVYMSSRTLGSLMRISVIATAICGLFLCFYVIPSWGGSIINANPEFNGWFWPWLIFAWLAALPCFAVLFFVWKVSGAVMQETVFTVLTAKWVKMGAVLLFSDAAFLFIGNIALLFLNMNHPGILLLFIIGDIFTIALALLAAALSRYLTKAAVLQEESEGTL